MELTGERWAQIQELFHRVVDAPAADRPALLEAACGEDADLRAVLLQLLDEDGREDSLLDREILSTAAGLQHDTSTAARRAFGPYRMLRPIGEGGTGTVYLAQRDDLGQRVAIKVLHAHWVLPSERERFTREQRTLARLNHPGIASLYDADTLADGTPWFAMEYVDGVSLTRYCIERGCSLAERLRLFRDVCDAAQHAHQHLIVHRDLKPSNILVTGKGAVRLLDFGIAKSLDERHGAGNQTQTVLRMMTPNYAAPEQLLGGAIGTHTDIYALGVILYELITGKPPFDVTDLTAGEAERLIVEQEPVRPSKAARLSGLDRLASQTDWKDLDVLCLTALRKDPNGRYRTVESLVQDLDRFQRGEPLAVREDSFGYRAAKFVRRNARPLAAAAAMFLIVASVVAFYTIGLRAARAVAVAEASRTARIQEFMLTLFDADDPDAAPAGDLRVTTLVERGVQEARSLDHEPTVQAALYHTLGTVYQRLGSLERGDALITAAVEARRKLLGADHPDTLESVIALGLLRVDQSRMDEAETLVREALDSGARALPDGHPVIVRATAALGNVLEDRGAYDLAIPMLERAAQAYNQSGSQERELSATLTELANAHFYAGHLDESEALNLRVLEIDKRVRGARHPNVADDLLNLGAIASNRERYVEATAYYRQALAIMHDWYGDDHPQTASAKSILAQGLMYQGQHDEAATLLRQALATQERALGPAHRRVGFVLNELGQVAIRRQDLDEAETAFQRSLDINRQVYPGGHFRVGVALANLGSVYVERAEYSRAEGLFREALAVYDGSLPPEHTNIAIVRIRLGRALVEQRRLGEAEMHLFAAYESLRGQAPPPARWVRLAREQLVRVWDALNRPDQARALRAEMESEGGSVQ